MVTNICSNCNQNTSCIYNDDSPHSNKLDCELHEIIVVPKATTINNNSLKIENINDLCSICDHNSDCSLKGSEQFIFQCEHYQ